MTRTFALIPAHNETLTVREVVQAAACHVDRVIVIDDGSTDGTLDQLAGIDAECVRHETNAGKGRRLSQGLAHAFASGAEQVIVLDADRQHDPEDIPAFLAKASDNPQALILGDRSADMASMPAHRRRGIKFGNFFIGWACGRRLRDAQCGMRLYPKAVNDLTLPGSDIEGFRFETAILMHGAEAGIPFAFVPVKARYEGFVLRPTHFHPILDFLRLFSLVSRFLLARGGHPRGLLIALRGL